MRIIFLVATLLTYTSIVSANSTKEKLSLASSLILDYPDSAYNIANEILIEAKSKSDNFAIVRSNFILGYIQDISRKEYGKAIIYYLEAIRYGELANYKDASRDLSLLYENCGTIFRKFKAFDLAKEYYSKGKDHASAIGDFNREVSLNYNLAGVYRDNNELVNTVDILNKYSKLLEVGSNEYFNYHNRLALTYRDAGDFDQAIEIHTSLIKELPENNFKRKGYYYHNLAKSYMEFGDYQNAITNLLNAIEYKLLNNSEKALFSSYFGLAEVHYMMQDFLKSKFYFDKAEKLIHLQTQHPDNFDLYKSQANLYYELGDYKKSKYYEDLYSESMNDYMRIQAEIQETDQRYNMDLITKRYFAEVDKQERIASILLFSKLTSGSLLALLFIVIAYHRYKRINLRKSIERELIALKIIE